MIATIDASTPNAPKMKPRTAAVMTPPGLAG
jgi:hypothetical protein